MPCCSVLLYLICLASVPPLLKFYVYKDVHVRIFHADDSNQHNHIDRLGLVSLHLQFHVNGELNHVAVMAVR